MPGSVCRTSLLDETASTPLVSADEARRCARRASHVKHLRSFSCAARGVRSVIASHADLRWPSGRRNHFARQASSELQLCRQRGAQRHRVSCGPPMAVRPSEPLRTSSIFGASAVPPEGCAASSRLMRTSDGRQAVGTTSHVKHLRSFSCAARGVRSVIASHADLRWPSGHRSH